MKCFDAISFISQYGTSSNRNGFFSSNKLGGIMTNTSSSGGLLKLFIIPQMKHVG